MSLLVIIHHVSYNYALKRFHFSTWMLSFFGNGQMWRCSQTRGRSYLNSPTIEISLWDSIIGILLFLNLGIQHFCLSNLTAAGTKHQLLMRMQTEMLKLRLRPNLTTWWKYSLTQTWNVVNYMYMLIKLALPVQLRGASGVQVIVGRRWNYATAVASALIHFAKNALNRCRTGWWCET